MGKYTQFQRKSPPKRKMHPIWRGIGCILLVIAPLFSYGLTVLAVPSILPRFPYQLKGPMNFPLWVYRSPITSWYGNFMHSFHNPWVNIITFIIILLVVTGITSLVYTMLYQLVGPARYTTVDAPPSKHTPKFFKR